MKRAEPTPAWLYQDIMSIANSGTHFGLNLPEGHYDLLVFADFNGNQQFDNTEIVGKHVLRVDQDIVT